MAQPSLAQSDGLSHTDYSAAVACGRSAIPMIDSKLPTQRTWLDMSLEISTIDVFPVNSNFTLPSDEK